MRLRTRTLVLSTLALFALLPALCCGIFTLLDKIISARAYLDRVVNMPTADLPLPIVEAHLLERVPVRSSANVVYSLLQQAGISEGGEPQQVYFQRLQNSPAIVATLQDPDYFPALLCTKNGYIITFQLDSPDRVVAISIRSTLICL